MSNRRTPAVIIISLCLLISWNVSPAGAGVHAYPRLANYYLPGNLWWRDCQGLSRWDVLVLHHRNDETSSRREKIRQIHELNPDIVMLVYFSSIECDVTREPPSAIDEACTGYDWWLRDYEGNYLFNPDFTSCKLINMTNTGAASGEHPDGLKPNEFLPGFIVDDHIALYDYWDGVFYDTFSEALGWMHVDIKDANRNGIPEYDNDEFGDEPRFSSLWTDGMATLVENTLAGEPNAIIVGNGLNRRSVEETNGRLLENFRLSSSKNMHVLSSVHQCLAAEGRSPRISIVNAYVHDENPRDYQTMRFTLCATLMTDAYYSIDFGSRSHAQTLWFDEFSVGPDGVVDAVTTSLSSDISADQITVPVSNTDGFEESGIIDIEGEQIYYEWKSESGFMDCYRGHPEKYDSAQKAPHESGSPVIQHGTSHKGYLEEPLGPAYDAADPAILLDDIFDAAGWFPDEEDEEALDSRVWRRDFQNGAVLVNPTGSSVLVEGFGENIYRKIIGLQDPVHNDGGVVDDTLRIPAGDGYILIRTSATDTIPPSSPEGFHVKP